MVLPWARSPRRNYSKRPEIPGKSTPGAYKTPVLHGHHRPAEKQRDFFQGCPDHPRRTKGEELLTVPVQQDRGLQIGTEELPEINFTDEGVV